MIGQVLTVISSINSREISKWIVLYSTVKLDFNIAMELTSMAEFTLAVVFKNHVKNPTLQLLDQTRQNQSICFNHLQESLLRLLDFHFYLFNNSKSFYQYQMNLLFNCWSNSLYQNSFQLLNWKCCFKWNCCFN